MAKHILLLTDSRYDNPTKKSHYISNILEEDKILSAALEQNGLHTTRVAWDDPNYNWQEGGIALFRTTWNYFDKLSQFRTWLANIRKCYTLINDISLINWNINKKYLFDLQENNIAIPDTVLVKANSGTDLLTIAAERQWTRIVIKPVISASGYNTYKLEGDELRAFQPAFARLTQSDDYLVQEFHTSILNYGEISLVFIGQEFSHAVEKKAKAGDYRVQDDFGGTISLVEPSIEQTSLARKAIRACIPRPVYARIDLIYTNQNIWAVSEVELIEPELWFRLKPESAETLATAIAAYLNSSQSSS